MEPPTHQIPCGDEGAAIALWPALPTRTSRHVSSVACPQTRGVFSLCVAVRSTTTPNSSTCLETGKMWHRKGGLFVCIVCVFLSFETPVSVSVFYSRSLEQSHHAAVAFCRFFPYVPFLQSPRKSHGTFLFDKHLMFWWIISNSWNLLPPTKKNCNFRCILETKCIEQY